MNGTGGYYAKWNKADRERQIPYDITYMWNLKYNTNEHIYETETDYLWFLSGGWGREVLGVWD